MNIPLLIAAIRQRCPSFSQRVAGAAQFRMLPESAALAVPAAFVIPLDDTPEENRSQTGYRQKVRDGFAVIIALSNAADERGQDASSNLHFIRRELFRALLGWQVDEDYDAIAYDGGTLLAMDRARLWYQFEFSASFEIGSEDLDTRQDVDLDALPNLTEIYLDDVVNPANISENTPAPDGRTTPRQRIDLPQP